MSAFLRSRPEVGSPGPCPPDSAGAFHFELEHKHVLHQPGTVPMVLTREQPKPWEEIYPATNGGAFF